MKFKDYTWALEGLAALVLLVGVVTMLIAGTETLSSMVIQLIGVGILFFTIMRIKPILASRDEKDFIIIMLIEIILAIIVGIMMLGFPDYVSSQENKVFSFSRLTGIIFYMRGIVHFYTTSKRYELHDLISFFVNILFISFGFLFLFNTLEANYIVYILYILALLLTGFFSYRSYNGYSNFRKQKMNKLKLQDYMDQHDNKEKNDVIEDPETIEEKQNPKIIEEPEEERPRVDIN